jgi:hypothetical protein
MPELGWRSHVASSGYCKRNAARGDVAAKSLGMCSLSKLIETRGAKTGTSRDTYLNAHVYSGLEQLRMVK